MAEEVDPETLAATLVEHVEQAVGEEEVDTRITRVVAELLGIRPAVLDHIVDKWFTDLTEQLSRRGEEDAVRAVLEVQNHWSQEV